MPSQRYGTAHQRARAALLRQIEWGVTCCCRCTHPLMPGDRVDLDHADDGRGYLGFSHHSACAICGRKCNQAAGGEKGALAAGKQLRDRRCCVCGMPFVASMAEQVTCGQRPCVTELRSRRRARQPDGEPPPPTGRVW